MADKPTEKHCAYCQAVLFEEDDVVWCPECGAPHHRACWQSLGHCAREALHGQPLPEEDEVVEEAPAEEPDPAPAGASVFPPEWTGTAFDPYAGVDPAGEMEGLPVTEVATFVRVNTRRYMPRFRRMCDTGRKVSWNVGGFLFAGVWFLYRKCYVEGIAALLTTVCCFLASVPLGRVCMAAAEEVTATLTQSQLNDPLVAAQVQAAFYEKIFTTAAVWQILLALAGSAVWVLLHVMIGLFGDRIYLRHTLDKVAAIRADDTIDNKLQALVAAGGVNPLLAATALAALQLALPYLLQLLA